MLCTYCFKAAFSSKSHSMRTLHKIQNFAFLNQKAKHLLLFSLIDVLFCLPKDRDSWVQTIEQQILKAFQDNDKRNSSLSEEVILILIINLFCLAEKSVHVFYNFVLHVFYISNSIFGVNVRVTQQIYVFKVKSCLRVAQLIGLV